MSNITIDLRECITKEEQEKEQVMATIKFNNVKPPNRKHQLVNLTNIKVCHESNN